MKTKKDYTLEELVQGCIDKNRACMSIIFDRYYKKAFWSIKNFHTDRQLIEDVVMQAFEKLFLHINKLSCPDKFESWFFRIVKIQAIQEIQRKELKLIRFGGSLDDTLDSFDIFDGRISGVQTYTKTFMKFLNKKEFRQEPYVDYDTNLIMTELDKLQPSEQKSLKEMMNGSTTKAVAEKLNICEGGVKRDAFNGRAKLRKVGWLKNDYPYLLRNRKKKQKNCR